MADFGANGPLIASLLQGQRQEENPFQAQRKYGRQLIVQGSSVEPLHGGGWLEGLSRALQAGIGGLTAGYANQQEEEQNKNNIDVYSRAAVEKDPAKIGEILKGLKGGGAQQEGLLGQIIQNNVAEGLKQQQAGGVLNRGGGLGGDVPGAPLGGGLGITITPGQGSNNPMNIRTTGTPWEGKTTPPGAPFETFANPQAGANATAKNFASYVRDNPNITVGEAIAKWAPAGDGANDPQAYAARIAAAGIPPTAKMADVLADPNAFAKLAMAGTGVEKGSIPPGFTPQVFAGAAQTAQPQGQPQGPQVAQAGPPAQMQLPQVPPAPDAVLYWKQAQQFAQQGDNVKAVEYKQKALEAQAKFAATLQEKQAQVGMQGTEHDRQQASATPSAEMSLSAGFADRMANSERMIQQFGPALTSGSAKAKDMLPFGAGNFMQSPEYQQAKQARDDFINAQLRRESGAAIAPTEYTNADRQYFPQPGDGPEVIAQKARNRQLAIEGMVRNSGPTYQPSQTVTKQQSGGGSDLVNQAREAIKQGAPRDKVIERLKQQGVSADGL